MKGRIIALATSIVAAATLAAPSAEAGMRIHFGFPIGAFNVGGGHSHYHRHNGYYEIQRYKALQRAKAAEAARLKREKAAAQAAAAKAKKEQAAAIAAARAAEKRKAAAAAALAAAEEKNKKLAEDQASVKSASNTDAVEPVVTGNTKSALVKTASNTTDANSSATDEAPAKLECKRYFANVGMTISVPCTE